MTNPRLQHHIAHQQRASKQASHLRQHLDLPSSTQEQMAQVLEQLSLGLPTALLGRLHGQNPGTPYTPLGRQFLPQLKELDVQAVELSDPISDTKYSPTRGIVHRHPDRVLLKPTLICPVYCRFCFRRAQVGPRPGGAAALGHAHLQAALDYIAQHSTIWEVILTGGDPLMLPPKRLKTIVQALANMPHVGALRIHTRVPLLAPQRVGQDMLLALQSRLACTLCVHVNHHDEFSPQGEAALAMFHQQGIMLLGQTVLLRKVNDCERVLAALFRKQVQHQIKPYYLHHCDLAMGVSHFRVSIAHGLALMQHLRKHVSGICLPSYVLDIPGGGGKVSLESNAVTHGKHGKPWRIRDFDGNEHVLPAALSG